MKSLRFRITAALLAAGAAQSGCDRGPEIGPPDKLTRVGNAQTAAAGSAVAIPPAVVIVDAAGTGVPGVTVTFAVVLGGGTITATTAQTDGSGTAKPGTWTLGTTAGTNSLSASSAGVPGSPVIFTATGEPGPTASLDRIGTIPVSTPAGGSIDSVIVRAIDSFGNPVPGRTINFTVTAGGGTASPASRMTLGDGRAASRWLMGSSENVQGTLVASLADGSLPQTFTTLTTRGVGALRMAAKVLVVDSLASVTPAVTIVDLAGAEIVDAGFTLETRNVAIATPGSRSVTGSRTGQTFVIARSTDNPAAADSALVIVGNIGAPVVTLGIPRFDLRADTTFTVSLAIDARSPGLSVGAATLRVVWDPALVTFAGDAPGSASADVAVNASSAAAGVYTVAIATGNGLQGIIEVRKLTFTASATAGRSGTMVVQPIDMASAGTFTDLLPRTVGGSFPLRIR